MATETVEQIACFCGSTNLETDDSACLVCLDCGRVVEEDGLVSQPPLYSSGEKPSYNVVPEQCNGESLVISKVQRRTRILSLQNQAVNKGREIELSEEVVERAKHVLAASKSHRVADEVAVAAALFLGSRIEGFPITLKSICLGLGAPLDGVRRAVIQQQGKLDESVPSIKACLATSAPITPA